MELSKGSFIIKEFISKYKPGDIIYPNAVAREFGIAIKDAYNELEVIRKRDKAIKLCYMLRCPSCGRTANDTRYYSPKDIDAQSDAHCVHCDAEFPIDLGKDVVVLYEKCEEQ